MSRPVLRGRSVAPGNLGRVTRAVGNSPRPHKQPYITSGARTRSPRRAQIRAAGLALGHQSVARAPRPAAKPCVLPAGSRSRVPVGFAPAGQGALPGIERRAGSGTKKRVPTQGGTLTTREGGLRFRRDRRGYSSQSKAGSSNARGIPMWRCGLSLYVTISKPNATSDGASLSYQPGR